MIASLSLATNAGIAQDVEGRITTEMRAAHPTDLRKPPEPSRDHEVRFYQSIDQLSASCRTEDCRDMLGMMRLVCASNFFQNAIDARNRKSRLMGENFGPGYFNDKSPTGGLASCERHAKDVVAQDTGVDDVARPYLSQCSNASANSFVYRCHTDTFLANAKHQGESRLSREEALCRVTGTPSPWLRDKRISDRHAEVKRFRDTLRSGTLVSIAYADGKVYEGKVVTSNASRTVISGTSLECFKTKTQASNTKYCEESLFQLNPFGKTYDCEPLTDEVCVKKRNRRWELELTTGCVFPAAAPTTPNTRSCRVNEPLRFTQEDSPVSPACMVPVFTWKEWR